MNKQKKIPIFETPAEEITFWQKHDSTKYIDWRHANKAKFPNLKPSKSSKKGTILKQF